MPSEKDISNLKSALQKGAVSANCTKTLADKIEDILISDDLREISGFDDLREILASFSPGGGVPEAPLYDEAALAKECKWVLDNFPKLINEKIS